MYWKDVLPANFIENDTTAASFKNSGLADMFVNYAEKVYIRKQSVYDHFNLNNPTEEQADGFLTFMRDQKIKLNSPSDFVKVQRLVNK